MLGAYALISNHFHRYKPNYLFLLHENCQFRTYFLFFGEMALCPSWSVACAPKTDDWIRQ